jgi:hypothetical protein
MWTQASQRLLAQPQVNEKKTSIRKSLPSRQYPGITSNLGQIWSNILNNLHSLPSNVAI